MILTERPVVVAEIDEAIANCRATIRTLQREHAHGLEAAVDYLDELLDERLELTKAR